MLELRPISSFILEHHRHHQPPNGGKFAVAVQDAGDIVGVAIAGRPVNRYRDDGQTLEITRVCVLDGHKNAASMLYGACWRSGRAMGYIRCLSYILQEEPGISLRAAGFKYAGMSRGGTWDRKGRSRFDKGPIEPKQIYEIGATVEK